MSSFDDTINMTSNQPYLIRAFYDWIVDNDLTPHLVVNANLSNVIVPTQFVQDGQIVLNVSPSACVNFHLDLDGVSFQARFSGSPMQVSFPCAAIMAIYARENGAGTAFSLIEESPEVVEEEQDNEATSLSSDIPPLQSVETSQEQTPEPSSSNSTKAKKPSLKIIK